MFPIKCVRVQSSWPVSTPPSDGEDTQTLVGAEAEQLFDKCLKTHLGPFEFDPENMVEVESCVQLCRPPEDEGGENRCELTFECLSSDLAVSRLVLVSQCMRVEVYGAQGEYKLTKEGTLLGLFFLIVAFVKFRCP